MPTAQPMHCSRRKRSGTRRFIHVGTCYEQAAAKPLSKAAREHLRCFQNSRRGKLARVCAQTMRSNRVRCGYFMSTDRVRFRPPDFIGD